MSRSQGIVIIGAGPAGCAAAVQCKRLGYTPLLIDRTGQAGGLVENAFSVENYPGVEPTDGPSFVGLLRRHIDNFGIGVEKGSVRRLRESQDGFVLTVNSREIVAKSVIVAVGTAPNLLQVPGAEECNGVCLYYDVCRIGRDLGNTLVVGGGEAALDYSLSMARNGSKVKILVRGERLRAKGRLVRLVEKSSSVRVHFGVRIQSVTGDSSGVVAITLTPEGELNFEADAMVVAVGRYPRSTEILKGLDVGPLGTVSTAIPGLFVVGDARTGALGQVGMAIGDGLEAAMAATDYID